MYVIDYAGVSFGVRVSSTWVSMALARSAVDLGPGRTDDAGKMEHERDARAYIRLFSHQRPAAAAAAPAAARPARFIERSSSACLLSTCGCSG